MIYLRLRLILHKCIFLNLVWDFPEEDLYLATILKFVELCGHPKEKDQ